MKFLTLILLVGLCSLASAQVPPPPAASQAEVNAGAVRNKFVSPATLSGWSGIQASNVTGFTTNSLLATNQTFVVNTWYTNNTTNVVQLTSVRVVATVAAVAGRSALDFINGSGTNTLFSQATAAGSVAGTYTNALPTLVVSNGVAFIFTNTSAGAGNSVAIAGGQMSYVNVLVGGSGGGGTYPTTNLTVVIGSQTPFQVNSNSAEIFVESTNLPVTVRGTKYLNLNTTAGATYGAHNVILRQALSAQAGGGLALDFSTPAYGTDGHFEMTMDGSPWVSGAFTTGNNSGGICISTPLQINKGESRQSWLSNEASNTNGYSCWYDSFFANAQVMTSDGDSAMRNWLSTVSSTVYYTGTDDGIVLLQDPKNQLPVQSISHSTQDGSVRWTLFSQSPSTYWSSGPVYFSWDGTSGDTLSGRNKTIEYIYNGGVTNFVITKYQTNAGDTATFTTHGNHNLNVSDSVVIYGLKDFGDWPVGSYFNNTYTVNAKTANTFTVDAVVDADSIPATLTNLNGYCYNDTLAASAVAREKLTFYGTNNTPVATISNDQFVVNTTIKNVGTVASASIGYPNSFAVGSPVERPIALTGVLTSAPPTCIICTPFTNIDAQVLFHAVVRSNNYVNVIFNTTATVTTGKTNTFYVTWIQ